MISLENAKRLKELGFTVPWRKGDKNFITDADLYADSGMVDGWIEFPTLSQLLREVEKRVTAYEISFGGGLPHTCHIYRTMGLNRTPIRISADTPEDAVALVLISILEDATNGKVVE